MPPATLPQPSNKAPASAVSKDFLSSIQNKSRNLPSRTLLHAVGKVGKTSWAAHAPGVVFITSPGETGLQTLIDAGQISDTPHFPEPESWSDVKGMISSLTEGEHQYKTLVIDTLNGLESMLVQSVCNEHFEGKMVSYNAFGSGAKVTTPEWRGFLASLDRLRQEKRMSIVCLCHSKLKPAQINSGLNYDRWQPNFTTDAIWDMTFGWFDTVMFAAFDVVVQSESPKATKGKAKGGGSRSMHIGPDPGWFSGSRFRLPDTISMGDSGEEGWNNFITEMKASKEKTKGGELA